MPRDDIKLKHPTKRDSHHFYIASAKTPYLRSKVTINLNSSVHKTLLRTEKFRITIELIIVIIWEFSEIALYMIDADLYIFFGLQYIVP